MDIKVSICIPAYRQVELLRRTLSSVREQHFSNYEIILSDDTPGDAVKELLSEFDFGDRLRYFKNSPSLGTPENWNHSIRQAKGEYIKLLHHDDFFLSPHSLGKYVALLDENPKADLAFSATQIWRLSNDAKWRYYMDDHRAERLKREPEYLFFGNWIGAPSAVICRRTVKEEYDKELKWLVDTDLYMRILKRNPVFGRTPEELVCTTDGAAGQVTQEVVNDKAVQIREHIYRYNKIRRPGLNEKKFSLFFQVLLNKYKVKDMTELAAITDIPNELRAFFTEVIYRKDRNVFLKDMAGWFYASRFNNQLFKKDRF